MMLQATPWSNKIIYIQDLTGFPKFLLSAVTVIQDAACIVLYCIDSINCIELMSQERSELLFFMDVTALRCSMPSLA